MKKTASLRVTLIASMALTLPSAWATAPGIQPSIDTALAWSTANIAQNQASMPITLGLGGASNSGMAVARTVKRGVVEIGSGVLPSRAAGAVDVRNTTGPSASFSGETESERTILMLIGLMMVVLAISKGTTR